MCSTSKSLTHDVIVKPAAMAKTGAIFFIIFNFMLFEFFSS